MQCHRVASGLHCFSTLCPGYVIVRSDIPPDATILNISTKGGKIAEIVVYKVVRTVHLDKIQVANRSLYDQDEANGNWGLEVPQLGVPIGFWPSKIFNAYNPPNKPGGPPMGTGLHILGRGALKWDAYCSNFVTVNAKFKTIDVDDSEEFCDSDKSEVKGVGHEIKKMGHVLFFGGPGR
ncbi:hypothetical protein Cgig2_003781 [Carnegiea gigantea]|uniref:Neprosin PEP catalytic domain-containing protein n=1 Tax=Carnegiea gigantea TaxID=171969 RepID=A0A9Q1JTV2_9CARY|nr:hypothetical protein Cgig2_003781 [Carnegiea gigantea]